MREALFTSAWFLRLPGPARQLVMHEVMSQLVREHVWGLLPDAVWAQRWHEVCLLTSVRPSDLQTCTAAVFGETSVTMSS